MFASSLNTHPDRADSNVPVADYSAVTADAVQDATNGTASDPAAIAPQLGAKFYTGSLIASPNANGKQYGCGIGGGYEMAAGNIVINGGTITANGGYRSAGIGSGCFGGCGDITISENVTMVTATKGTNAPNSIGAAADGSCGAVTIADPSKVIQN